VVRGLTEEELNARHSIDAVASPGAHCSQPGPSAELRGGHAVGRIPDGCLESEMDPRATRAEVKAELSAALIESMKRLRAFSPEQYKKPPAAWGGPLLPTTIGGCWCIARITPSAT